MLAWCSWYPKQLLNLHCLGPALRHTDLGLGGSPLISFSSQWPLAKAIFTSDFTSAPLPVTHLYHRYFIFTFIFLLFAFVAKR